jgi:hypothetical protein
MRALTFPQRCELIIGRYLPKGVADVSEKTRIPVSRWNEFLAGSEPTLSELVQILFNCDVSGEWLVTGSGEPLHANQLGPLMLKCVDTVRRAASGRIKSEDALTAMAIGAFHAATSGMRGGNQREDAVPFASRIRQLIGPGETAEDLAELTDIRIERIEELLDGAEPRLEDLSALVSRSTVNADWLLTGQGQIVNFTVLGSLLSRSLNEIFEKVVVPLGLKDEAATAKMVNAHFLADLNRRQEAFRSIATMRTIELTSSDPVST